MDHIRLFCWKSYKSLINLKNRNKPSDLNTLQINVFTDSTKEKLTPSLNTERTLMHLLLFTNSAQRELVSRCTQSIHNRNWLSLHYNLGSLHPLHWAKLNWRWNDQTFDVDITKLFIPTILYLTSEQRLIYSLCT